MRYIWLSGADCSPKINSVISPPSPLFFLLQRARPKPDVSRQRYFTRLLIFHKPHSPLFSFFLSALTSAEIQRIFCSGSNSYGYYLHFFSYDVYSAMTTGLLLSPKVNKSWSAPPRCQPEQMTDDIGDVWSERMTGTNGQEQFTSILEIVPRIYSLTLAEKVKPNDELDVLLDVFISYCVFCRNYTFLCLEFFETVENWNGKIDVFLCSRYIYSSISLDRKL